MKEPFLKDYGLTESIVASQKRRNKAFGRMLAIIFIVIYFLIAVILLAYSHYNLFFVHVITSWVFLLIFQISISQSKSESGKTNKAIIAYERAVINFQQYQLRLKEHFWYSLSGHKLEIEITDLFLNKGFDARRTKGSGDGGVDIIFTNNDKTYTVVQCKAHKNPVGPHVARDLFGVMKSINARDAILINLSGFTKGVYSFVRDKNIKLMDVSDIIKMQDDNNEVSKRVYTN